MSDGVFNVFELQCVDENQDEEGPSSDYGSEEMVSPKCDPDEPTSVTYMPKNTPNGCVSVAPDYNYPMNKVHIDVYYHCVRISYRRFQVAFRCNIPNFVGSSEVRREVQKYISEFASQFVNTAVTCL